MNATEDTFTLAWDGQEWRLPRACPHRGGRLDLGHLNRTRGTVTCPLHQATFEIATGRRLSGPACAALSVCPADSAGPACVLSPEEE